MEIVTIHTVRKTLLRLLARVEAGEEIVLARGKQPYVDGFWVTRPVSLDCGD